MENHINGGATIWARQTTKSDIFFTKPDKWFKIWFFIISKANHKDTKQFKRGECFLTNNEIAIETKSTIDQVKKCLGYLRGSKMINTNRSTRGFTLIVNKYNKYQDLDNYIGTREAPEKHQRSTTINKNEKNKKNTLPAVAGLEDKKKKMKPYQEPSIDIETGELIKETDNGGKVMRELIAWAENRRGGKFLNFAKQMKAIKTLKDGGYDPDEIKERYMQMEKDDFWKENGMDFMSVVGSFSKKPIKH